MERPLPEAEFGPDIAFREYSMLDNPKAKVADGDVVTVHVCRVSISSLADKRQKPAIFTSAGVVLYSPGDLP